jgi:ribosome-associated heat shock protein Hsp15
MEPQASIRLDKWLWHARFVKSRALAQRLITGGAARVNAVRVLKPATTVRVGDGLSFAQGREVRAVRILALGSRRGPASEAQTLYAEIGSERARASGPDALEPVRQADK